MKALIKAVIWALFNILGGWLLYENLFHVGKLGVAAVGLLILMAANVWLAWSMVALIRGRAHEPALQPEHAEGLR